MNKKHLLIAAGLARSSGPRPVRYGLRFVWVVAVVGAAVFCGMFAPTVFGVSHRNAIWEPVFGLGYLVAGIFFHPYTLNRIAGIIGLVAWPLLPTFGIAIAGWKLTAKLDWRTKCAAGFFVLSLLFWVSNVTANQLSAHWVPFFFNYYSANF